MEIKVKFPKYLNPTFIFIIKLVWMLASKLFLPARPSKEQRELKREKAENAARFAELELSIEKIQKEKSDNSARFADLELSIEEMKKIQSKAAKKGKRKKWAILYLKCWKNKLAKL